VSLFDRVAEWIFSAAVKRERQRAAIYARGWLATWDRHRIGATVEHPDMLMEAARCCLDWYGEDSQHSLIARAVLWGMVREHDDGADDG